MHTCIRLSIRAQVACWSIHACTRVKVDTRSFWEHYMPVFHDCIVSAKAMHAMCSYNSM